MTVDWPTVEISEACELIIDCVNKTAPVVEGPTPYKMIRTTNVRDGWVDTTNVRYVDEEIYVKWVRRGTPKNGDVILTREAPLGEVGLLRDASGVFLGQRLVMYRAAPEKLDNKFLLYSLLHHDLQGQIKAFGSGSTVEHMRVPDCEKLLLRLPPLKTQHKIASILSAYDDLIENNTRRIKILEEMAQAIYREWFVNFRFPGHEQVKMVDSPMGEIPEGWEIATVQDSFEILGGGTPSKKEPAYWDDGIINWYSPTDLTSKKTLFMDDSAVKITALGLKKSSARIFPAYSVMMTSRATLGVIAINTTEACTNQGFITCLPNDIFPLYMLYHWLQENVDKFISLASGATFKEITKGVFKTIELAVPPTELSRRFEEIVSSLGAQLLNLQRKNLNLRQTRDLLLPRLVSGEIDLSDLEIENKTA